MRGLKWLKKLGWQNERLINQNRRQQDVIDEQAARIRALRKDLRGAVQRADVAEVAAADMRRQLQQLVAGIPAEADHAVEPAHAACEVGTTQLQVGVPLVPIEPGPTIEDVAGEAYAFAQENRQLRQRIEGQQRLIHTFMRPSPN